jgi:hypothetical protein
LVEELVGFGQAQLAGHLRHGQLYVRLQVEPEQVEVEVKVEVEVEVVGVVVKVEGCLKCLALCR